jgi:hypothetical protein
MTSSDRSFEQRLREALGEPMTPTQLAALDARFERRPSERGFFRQRTLRRSLLLVAVVVVALPLAALAGIIPGSDEVPPPPELEDKVFSLFSEEACVSPQVAEQEITAVLADLGYSEWSVAFGTGAADSECVAAGLDGQTRTVLLFMALPPDVRTGLARVQELLYIECRSKDEATALIEAVLRDAGMENWKIETSSGAPAVPIDRAEEIERHVENGCWVYSTTGWTADGTRVFWIAGN